MKVDSTITQLVLRKVDEKIDDLIDFTKQLIQQKTITDPPSGHEKCGQDVISNYLKEMNCLVDVFEPTEIKNLENHEGYWPGWDYADRPNVVGVWKGIGGGRSIILNGHIDVVSPGNPKLWKHDPFGGEIDQGRIYGRGASDMKGPIAGMIYAVKILQDLGVELKGDIIIESVVNEELGGYNGSLACILRGYSADLALVTEPTELRICPGQKGGQVYRLFVPGFGAHSARWWKGVSAIDMAIFMKEVLGNFQKIRSEENRNNLFFGDQSLFPIPALVDDIYSFHSGDPEIMGNPTEAEMEFWFDVLPGEDLEEVLHRFETYLMDSTINHPFLSTHPPRLERSPMRPFYPTSISPNFPAIEMIKDGISKVIFSQPVVSGFESACEAMMFNKWSKTPALIFGPGNIELAHRPDEYIDMNELVSFVKILALFLIDWCGQS